VANKERKQDEPLTPSQVLARRLRELRNRQGLTAKGLSERLRERGVNLGRVAIAKIEIGERGVSLDEALALAYALNVAPVYLFLPLENDQPVRMAEDKRAVKLKAGDMRGWVSGRGAAQGQDKRFYLMEVDEERFEDRRRTVRWAEETLREEPHLLGDETTTRLKRLADLIQFLPEYQLGGEGATHREES
jgi:transcriptional regulator with XRE-family HTH domain